MYIVNKKNGVPQYEVHKFFEKKKDYVLLIPIINEGNRIKEELKRACDNNVSDLVDIVICDGDSKDGSTDETLLKSLDVNTLLVKKDEGKQGAQLRMGIDYAFSRNYEGILTIDGNNKDSIEDVYKFIDKLKEGYDLVQGSRFIKGGKAINTPLSRFIAVKFIHAPIISLTARKHFTDTTNAYRAYSKRYLQSEKVKPLRDIFYGYELLAYLSTRATQIGMKACEVPVTRAYPKGEKTPTKISKFSGNFNLIKILINNFLGKYNP